MAVAAAIDVDSTAFNICAITVSSFVSCCWLWQCRFLQPLLLSLLEIFVGIAEGLIAGLVCCLCVHRCSGCGELVCTRGSILNTWFTCEVRVMCLQGYSAFGPGQVSKT